jgi:hypothetical protein
MKNDIKRIMWCATCNDFTNNLIDYRGTQQKDGATCAHFYSACCRCMVNNRCVRQVNTIPVRDYNALVSKEIFA